MGTGELVDVLPMNTARLQPGDRSHRCSSTPEQEVNSMLNSKAIANSPDRFDFMVAFSEFSQTKNWEAQVSCGLPA